MAKQNAYTQLAVSRASFFTKGSPVQYVQAELLREESSGNTLVTLTLMNLYQRMLTRCVVHFTCKNALGAVVAEDDFVYEGMSVPEAEMFGSDDAVFVSSEEISGVEVSLVSITFENSREHDMTNYEKIKLPSLRPLREEARAVMYETLGSEDLHYKPNSIEEGWQCTCGAFNYNAGHSVEACNECGMNRQALFNAVREMESPSMSAHDGTRVFAPVQGDSTPTKVGGTRMFTPPTQGSGNVAPAARRRATTARTVSLMSDDTAKFINTFVPFIAAGASLIYVLGALGIKALLF